MDPCLPRPVAFWLLPAEPVRSRLHALIQQFAARFGAPAFMPHLTVQGNLTLSLTGIETHFAALAEGVPAFSLPVIRPDGTPAYFKAFFLALGTHPALEQLAAAIRSRLAPGSEYRLRPHVSLLYADLSPETRAGLLQTFQTELGEIPFDTLALATPGDLGWADVAGWKIPLSHPLGTRHTVL